MSEIDFVVTWLDDRDQKWRNNFNKYSPQKEGMNDDARFRDLETFKYFFRAIEKYAPWVRKIHVITEGHFPDFLKKDHKKIHHVKHSDYIPKEYLPTFSSPVIELNLHKIPELSENFVLFNDDFFLNQNVVEKDFFKNNVVRDSLAIVPLTTRDPNSSMELNNMLLLNKEFDARKIQKELFPKLFSFHNGLQTNLMNFFSLPFPFIANIYNPHITTSCTKDSFKETWEIYARELDKGCREKFRSKESYSRFLVRNRVLLNGNFYPKNMTKFGQLVGLQTGVNYSKILRSKKKVICFNDSELLSHEEFLIEKKKLIKAFEEKFSEKSSFEK